MKFVITELNFSRSYSYNSDGIDIHWSINGLVLSDSMDVCEINGVSYVGGSVIPWTKLTSGKLKYHDEEIPVSFIEPGNEKQWIRFVQEESFPQIERLQAYQVYFGEQYISRTLNKSLSISFFSRVFNAYNVINSDSNNRNLERQVLCWKRLYFRFLSELLIDNSDNSQCISDIVSIIKNLEIK